MTLSTKKQTLLNRYEIEAEDLAYCDLVLSGWGKVDAAFLAYNLAYNETSRVLTFVREHSKNFPGIDKYIADKTTEDMEEKKSIQELKKKLSNKQATTQDSGNNEITAESLRTKTGMLSYLIDLAATPGLDLKTKADIAKQITDLQQYKKEDIKEEDTRTHFYLPLTCAKCALYQDFKRKQKEQQQNEHRED